MVTVDSHPFDNGLLLGTFIYSRYYINRFRKVPGAKYSRQLSAWVFPIGAIDYFENLFKGEIFYKTPRWVLLNDTMPDYKEIYSLNSKYPVPELNYKLYNYQEYGVQFMIQKLLKHGFVINADDVGLGKTIQSIATLRWAQEYQGVTKTLILCKKSLKTQWKTEGVYKFTNLNSTIVKGSKAKRKEIYDDFNKKYNLNTTPSDRYGTLITNYHTVLNDEKELQTLDFDFIIIDESHLVKARTGKMNKAITKIAKKAKYVVFLTGTPVVSKPDDVYGIVQIADNNYFGSWKTFESKHIVRENTGRFIVNIGYKELDILREKVQDIIIRRTEHEVDIELPEIIVDELEVSRDMIQIVIDITIEEEQSKYSSIIKKVDRLGDKATEKQRKQALMAESMVKGLTAAKQASANDPRLFLMSKSKTMVEKYGALVPQSYKASPKTESIIDTVQNIVASGHKVILFTKFERQVRLISQDLQNSMKKNPILVYTGEVDEDTRDKNIDLFKHNPFYQVIIGTDAMSEGLNLQMAKYIIHIDQPDSPAVKMQRNGRARRTNSKHKHVYAYDFITLESKDVERRNNLKNLQNLVDGVVGLDKAQSIAIKKAITSIKD